MPKHIDELRVFLASSTIDILAINGTTRDSSIHDNEVHILGYEIVRRDRSFNGRSGGGVCFYIRNCINYPILSDLCIKQLENLCIEICKPRSRSFLVITWYRPPDSTVDKFDVFQSLVGRLDTLNAEFYIMGDINCNVAAPELDHNSRLLNDIANLFSLHQLINEPTRVSLTSSSLIDLIFTNCSDRLSFCGVYPTTINDHSLVYAYRKLSAGVQSGNHSTVTYRRCKNFDPTKFRNDICSQDWDSVKMFDNPNGMWHD